jgi:hypothetical protein
MSTHNLSKRAKVSLVMRAYNQWRQTAGVAESLRQAATELREACPGMTAEEAHEFVQRWYQGDAL